MSMHGPDDFNALKQYKQYKREKRRRSLLTFIMVLLVGMLVGLAVFN